MSSVQALREFINQRLTAAAGEIFTVFQQTIVQYEEEIRRQLRLLEIIGKPQIKLHRTELHQHPDCREKLFFKQETSYCLEQEEPEPPQIKKEPEAPQKFYIFHSERVENVPVSEKQAEGEKLLCEETSGEIVCKKSKLYRNLRTRSEKKKVICEICVKSYSRRDSLLVHMRTHTGEKPYSCETCGKSFSVHSTWLCHMRTHTAEKPFSCETCGGRFTKRSSYFAHMRTHTGEKPYCCQTCGRSFSVNSTLLCHMRSHTGEKPYSCKTCGKNFGYRSSLLKHKKTHTEMKT